MKLENTSFTREHSSQEEKAEGFKEVRTTDDIWTRKRGDNDQLAELFVAMARAAGMKAYLAAVTNRDHSLFLAAYLSLSQLDDEVAIVNVDGKEQYFDPGARYCPYQHLAWKHTQSAGIRQTASGADIVQTPGEAYTYSRTQRVANLTMDKDGDVTGNIKMTYMGSPGLNWRQQALTGDAASLDRELSTSVEHLLPNGLEVKVSSIEKLEDYDQPLVVKLDVKGRLGSSTGKRLLIPGDIFEANVKPAFPHEKRDIPVFFNYSHMMQDAVRITFPPSLTVESIPASDTASFQKFALYGMKVESTPTTVTMHRDYALGVIYFKTEEYPELRSFYSKMENKDQETIVLTSSPSAKPVQPAGN